MQYCKLCGNAGDTYGNCGRFVTPCPPPEEAEPSRVTVLHCETCQITKAVSAATLARGENPISNTCKRDKEHCHAVIVSQAKAPKVPAKRTDAPPV